ncbi:hypothetical protein acsn021_31490 [Anaerocolumna cellulosilytica]|uniref:Formamidopyrimidine-DNA glycosylase H2TH DNA-binding domain-containing protein n=1 Tax=Anaerocolumna cellulosilytica TaxID=433286 RepID=A0A6S6R7Y4_9FIRM|nr:hypothetical protein [Anaerocolumna cellulosilytica]MBB5198077.1 formamidopyrimidine-DNA glycosylase [Anaerocolumna cellulosilytica]BCJ95580.1 hypothetical protein acsn021_31490 [Anaerocolumna cellulosilytica]
MYGGLCAFSEGENDNPYYLLAKQKPSPYSDDFTMEYFKDLLTSIQPLKTSAKAFLATEQRIPGLGNGVLQDILYKAWIHPKTKISTLLVEQLHYLYQVIKKTLLQNEKGGRDTEKDLFGQPGGYKTKLSKKTVGTKCPKCWELIIKAYLSGSIYYCTGCQKVS